MAKRSYSCNDILAIIGAVIEEEKQNANSTCIQSKFTSCWAQYTTNCRECVERYVRVTLLSTGRLHKIDKKFLILRTIIMSNKYNESGVVEGVNKMKLRIYTKRKRAGFSRTATQFTTTGVDYLSQSRSPQSFIVRFDIQE